MARSNRIRAGWRRAGLTLAGAAAIAGFIAAPAQAFSNSYCGVLISQNSWCGDGSNHTYNYNRAEYTGAGSVYVCERMLYADTTVQRAAPFCAYTYAARSYGATVTLFEAEVTHMLSGGAHHTIYGYAVA